MNGAEITKSRVLLVGVLILLILSQLQILSYPFLSDDYHVLSRIDELLRRHQGISYELLLQRQFDHVLPLRTLTLSLQWIYFGRETIGYYAVSIAFHLIACSLLFVWTKLLFRDERIALLAACLFGVSGIHWGSVSWISTQSQLLAACFLFGLLICVHHSILKAKPAYLLLAALLHLCMALNFTSGFETPFFVFFYSLILQGGGKAQPVKSLLRTLPFLGSIFLLFFIRSLGMGAVEQARHISSFAQALEAGIAVGYGFFAQFAASATGLVPLAVYSRKLCAFGSLVLLLPWGYLLYRKLDRKTLQILLLLISSGLLLFSFPAIGRIGRGYHYIIETPWYRYLPNTMFVPATALSLTTLYDVLRPRLGFLALSPIALVLLLNTATLVSQQRTTAVHAERFEKRMQRALVELRELVGKEENVILLERHLDTKQTRRASYRVRPKVLCLLKAGPKFCGQVSFHQTDGNTLGYVIDPQTGHLHRMGG